MRFLDGVTRTFSTRVPACETRTVVASGHSSVNVVPYIVFARVSDPPWNAGSASPATLPSILRTGALFSSAIVTRWPPIFVAIA